MIKERVIPIPPEYHNNKIYDFSSIKYDDNKVDIGDGVDSQLKEMQYKIEKNIHVSGNKKNEL